MKKAIVILLFSLVSAFADTDKYHYKINDSITTFFLLNYYQIYSDLNNNSNGEYLNSLFSQLKIDNKSDVLIGMKKVFDSEDTQFNKISKIKKEILFL